MRPRHRRVSGLTDAPGPHADIPNPEKEPIDSLLRTMGELVVIGGEIPLCLSIKGVPGHFILIVVCNPNELHCWPSANKCFVCVPSRHFPTFPLLLTAQKSKKNLDDLCLTACPATNFGNKGPAHVSMQLLAVGANILFKGWDNVQWEREAIAEGQMSHVLPTWLLRRPPGDAVEHRQPWPRRRLRTKEIWLGARARALALSRHNPSARPGLHRLRGDGCYLMPTALLALHM